MAFRFLKRVMGGSVVGDASRLLLANAVAQAIGLLIYPLLTRLFTAEDFGLFNLFFSIAGILILFATGQYEYAIVLPRSERQGAWALHCGLTCTAAVVTLCVVALPFGSAIGHLFGSEQLNGILWLMPLYVALMAVWTLINYWLTRQRQFQRIAEFQVGQSVLNAATKVLLGKVRLASGLILGSVIGPLTSLVVTILRTPRRLFTPLKQWSRRGRRAAAHRYRNFPIYVLPKSVAENFAGNLPFFLLSPAFGLEMVGFFGMALTLAYRPLQMIAVSVNQVLFQRSAECVQKGTRLMPLIHRWLLSAAGVAVPVLAVLWLVLPQLCAWLLGTEWVETGNYIRLMLPWLLFVLLVVSINFIPDLFGKQRGMLIILVIRLILQTAGLIVGIALDSSMLAVGLFFAVGLAALVAQLVWFLSLINRYESKLK